MSKRSLFSRRSILKTSTAGVVIIGGGYGTFRYFSRPAKIDAVHSQPLPLPELLPGTPVNGKQIYDLTAQKGTANFVVDKASDTFGYNGNILGPTLILTKGEAVVINVTNGLGEPTTTHWHGFHLPSIMDGGPHQTIEDGQTWNAAFTVMNEAATYFYHPHLMHKTGEQVYRGLAGMIIVNDPENPLALPDQYGIDDIPLIVQDKSFKPDGSLYYSGKSEGVKGEHILVNGAITPIFQAPAQLVRFRLLNASNARVYNFGFRDDRQFQQIGTDGGALEKPVSMNRLLLAPAERAEIVVDFGGQRDTQLRLLSYSYEVASLSPFWARDALDKQAFEIMTIKIAAPTETRRDSLPGALATIVPLAESEAKVVRKFVLEMKLIGGAMTINGQGMDIDRIDQTVQLGETEIWEISNPSDLAHPFHIHDIQFQILTRNGQKPPENERGWKDTVFVKQEETVRLIAKFSDFADPDTPYMFHCHTLEHEDAGMMGQFVVV